MGETLTKTDVINIINEGFEQVILPHIVEIKGDVQEIKETLDDHGNRLERVERKLNAVADSQDRQWGEIKKIKTHISIT